MKNIFKRIGLAFLLVLIPFFLFPLYEAKLLFTLPIFIIFIYSLLDLYYPFLVIPSIIYYRDSIINLLPLMFFTIGLTLIIRIIFNKRKEVMALHPVVNCLLINTFYLLINNRFNFEILIFNILVSILLSIVIMFTFKQFKTDNRIVYRIKNINLLSVIVLSFMVLGSIFYQNRYFNFDITFILISLGILFLGYIECIDYSFVFSIFGLIIYNFYFKNIVIGLMFPFLSLLFIKGKKFNNLIIAILILLDLYYFKAIKQDEYEIMLIFILLFFEILKLFINLFPFYKKNPDINLIYNNVVENFNDQIIKFAGFLDEFSRNFITNTEENIRLNEAFNNLIQSFCVNCPKRNICFKKEKSETYFFLKNCLSYGNKLHIKKNTLELKEMVRKCYYSNQVIEKASMLKNKYRLFQESSQNEKTLEKQLNGLSNTLRQYVVDLNSKKNLDPQIFSYFSNILKDLGYEIVLYNIKKSFVDDYWLEIGIINSKEKEIEEIIKPLAEKYFGECSLEFIKQDTLKAKYFSIIPKIKFIVNYGYASLAKQDLNVIGDNYLIKNLGDGTFIAAISDGMGSGYKAFQESKSTIKLIDRVTEFEVNCHTSMNILNTFYSLKDSFDQYATLDYLQINRKNGEAFLYKMGGTNTYIIRNGDFIVIENSNLPFGISDLIKHENFQVLKNDLIVLMSDGIMDSIKENELLDMLIYSEHKEPQKVCYEIIDHISRTNNTIKDDMSIILLKVE